MIAPHEILDDILGFYTSYVYDMAHDVYPRVVYTSKQFENNGNEARNEVVEIMAELNTKMPHPTRNAVQQLATSLYIRLPSIYFAIYYLCVFARYLLVMSPILHVFVD